MSKIPEKITAFQNSFLYAFRGIRDCLAHERNMRVHLSAAVVVTVFSVSYGLSPAEYGMLFFAVGLVMCAEALNTGIERAVDLVTQEKKPLAGAAKDCAAAGVLIAAAAAAAVGIALFGSIRKLTETFSAILSSPLLTVLYLVLLTGAVLFSFWGDRLFRR